MRTELTEGSRGRACTECLKPKGTLVEEADNGGSIGEGEGAAAEGESGDFKLNLAEPSCEGGRDGADAELGDRCGEESEVSSLNGVEKFGTMDARELGRPGGEKTGVWDVGEATRLVGVEVAAGCSLWA